jgi:aldose 1-epimerase
MVALPSPSGPGYALRAGPYTAAVRAVGASPQHLRWEGRDLVLPFADDQVRPLYRGAILAPWPNRVGGGRWTWQGQPQQLALTEPDPGHALHGLVAWAEWSPSSVDEAAVTLGTTVWPQPGFPFCLHLEVEWALDAVDGLTCRLVAVNAGSAPAPYGCSIHPYLVAPGGALDDWTLELRAERELLVGDDLLPTDLTDPSPAHDFRGGKTLAGSAVDNAYTDVAFDERGQATATVVDQGGAGTRITFTDGTPWVQVCTSDWPGPSHRAAVAIEPMTCPPDALRSGTDLVVLEPGAQHQTLWRLEAVA